MQKLISGLHHFQNNIFDEQRELFERLARGQKPDALFIACSDSRVIPHLFTQASPGELFVVRNVGNLVPAHGQRAGAEAAAIEYAVGVLGVRDIIVCGHSQCGAMQALLFEPTEVKRPALEAWLSHAAATRQIVCDHYADATPERRLAIGVQENVLVQIENLRTHPTIRSHLVHGRVRLHGWVYKIETGEVFGYDPSTGQFAPLGLSPEPPALTAVPGLLEPVAEG